VPRDRSPWTTRRRALAALGSIALGAFPGCSSNGDDQTSRAEKTTTSGRTTGTTPQPTQQRDPSTTTDRTTAQTTQETNSWTRGLTGTPRYADDPDWRCVCHDHGNTSHNPHADGPETEPTVRWTVDVGGGILRGYTTHHPLILGDTVYAAIKNPEGNPDSFVAIDAETGQTTTLFQADGRLWRPSIIDGTVYVAIDAAVAAFDLETGREQWRSDPIRGGPAVVRPQDGIVVTGNDWNLFGFDADTGDRRWKKEGRHAIGGEMWIPVVADGTVAHTDTTSLFDLQTGTQRAKFSHPLYYLVLSDGELFGLGDAESEGYLSYDWETLERRWEYQEYEPAQEAGGFAGIHDDVVVINHHKLGVVGVDRETGDRIWNTDVGDFSPLFTATDRDTAYLSNKGTVVALDIQTGQQRWWFDPIEEDVLSDGIALANDLLVVPIDGKLYALE
jgi:outer membrane protein assembly factor BamB